VTLRYDLRINQGETFQLSAAWTWRTGRWDVELVDGAGAVTRLAEGFVIVHPEVSRS